MLTKICSKLWTMSAIEVWCTDTIEKLFKSLFSVRRRMSLVATLTAILSLCTFIIDREPIEAFGPEVDLDGYELVFEDEFDGDSLDMTNWKHRGGAAYNGTFALDTVTVSDGALHIRAEYLEDGSEGPGWYSGSIALRKRYLRGYFECTCKVNDYKGFWSAFWMQGDHALSKEGSNGGINGCEIDIMESCALNSNLMVNKDKDCVIQCLHVNGGTGDTTEDSDSSGAIFFKGNNIYTEYNTYGMMWTEDEYIFYVNGKESFRTSWWDGVCTEPEEVILSLCIPNTSLDGLPHWFTQEFTVDSVRIYQLAE